MNPVLCLARLGCIVSLLLGCAGNLLANQAPAQKPPQTQSPNQPSGPQPSAAPVSALTDTGWPRNVVSGETTITVFQPQIDTWDGFRLTGRAAVAVTEKAGAPPYTASCTVGRCPHRQGRSSRDAREVHDHIGRLSRRRERRAANGQDSPGSHHPTQADRAGALRSGGGGVRRGTEGRISCGEERSADRSDLDGALDAHSGERRSGVSRGEGHIADASAEHAPAAVEGCCRQTLLEDLRRLDGGARLDGHVDGRGEGAWRLREGTQSCHQRKGCRHARGRRPERSEDGAVAQEGGATHLSSRRSRPSSSCSRAIQSTSRSKARR